jgi:hypothetical protein
MAYAPIQSNIMAAATLVLAALVRRDERSQRFDAVRGAVTFYLAITGIVFALLLSGLQEQLDTHNAFANFVVHYLIPAVLIQASSPYAAAPERDTRASEGI